MKPYLRDKKVFAVEDINGIPTFEAGYLVSVNSGWRSKCPKVDNIKCVGCMQCYLHCPDGVIVIQDGKAVVDHNFCKGCGICKTVCKLGAIEMEDEY
ncbi:MAG: pyruvate ferredoxin oxidoreductase [Cellulosilyticum sp.]|nr:pyruvate ferredoxin oxidoreductase [Cellulosilyticum sp.]